MSSLYPLNEVQHEVFLKYLITLINNKYYYILRASRDFTLINLVLKSKLIKIYT
jgi:hypothetical protein